MRAKQRCWTDEETALAIKMLDERAPEHQFIEMLGRTKISAYARRERLNFLSATRPFVEQPEQFSVPVEVWIDRARRIAAPRSITATILGDPPFSQSALGKKMAGAS